MKKVLASAGMIGMLLTAMSPLANAGAVRFAAKSSYKAAKFASFPARHPKKDAHAAAKSAKFLAKLVF